ncbi:hypothetical protein [Nostoc sp.]|uniref:hypothetical protein n=1 Tax=Nostoc sp. TaxID=1180 RepID=UPI002FF5ABBF
MFVDRLITLISIRMVYMRSPFETGSKAITDAPQPIITLLTKLLFGYVASHVAN